MPQMADWNKANQINKGKHLTMMLWIWIPYLHYLSQFNEKFQLLKIINNN